MTAPLPAPLPERLRKLATYHEGQIDYSAATMLLADAADEIERLRNSNTALRSAVEALSKELTTEAQSMMRQPEAGVIRGLAERLHAIVFRRKWRDAP